MKANMKSIRNVVASILLVICLCISMVGCADNQATTDPTNESVAAESTGNVTEAQTPDETDAAKQTVKYTAGHTKV